MWNIGIGEGTTPDAYDALGAPYSVRPEEGKRKFDDKKKSTLTPKQQEELNKNLPQNQIKNKQLEKIQQQQQKQIEKIQNRYKKYNKK